MKNKISSKRLQYLTRLEKSKSFNIISFRCISYYDVEKYIVQNDSNGLALYLLDYAIELENNRIFVHPAPRDEHINPGYSFAGVYKSYKPHLLANRYMNILYSMDVIFNNRFSSYADYYYSNNSLQGTRTTDFLLSCEAENTRGFGTGYVDFQVCIFQVYMSPLSIYQKEAHKHIVLKHKLNSTCSPLIKNIAKALFAVQEQFNELLDIEFIVNTKNDVYINEIRPLSAAHTANWEKINIDSLQTKISPSCIINSIGERTGVVRICENSIPVDYNPHEEIICIEYNSDTQIQHILLSSSPQYLGTVIIIYPSYIYDNHLSYILFEDCRIEFLIRTQGLRLSEGQRIRLISDGIRCITEAI